MFVLATDELLIKMTELVNDQKADIKVASQKAKKNNNKIRYNENDTIEKKNIQ
jgi:hypothetical protein